MTAYYNEIDPYAAQWLRNLIKAGHIAPGIVDERSIEDVTPGDLAGFAQCHFFAGIGVWSYALRRSGWPDNRPVWTGSCPCQPFSTAGKGAGFADERHLWPAWFHLISQCRPPTVFGEQVASRDGLAWLDLVYVDMEAAGYAVGSADMCAAGVGAPHIRQRLWFVADTDRDRQHQAPRRELHDSEHHAEPRGVLGDTDRQGLEIGQMSADGGRAVRVEGAAFGSAELICGFWSGADWIACRDSKWRPVEPGSFPLAHGVANRVGRLRAYGNAICAPVAEAFARAYQDAMTL